LLPAAARSAASELAALEEVIHGIRYDWRNNSVLFLHNLASEPREVTFAIKSKSDSGKLLVNLLGGDHSTAARNGRHSVCLEAFGYRWYRVHVLRSGWKS
jgi:maltose alpha-D-glucosyltransferase / alpha-amylase